MKVMLTHSNSLPDCFQIGHVLDVFFIALDEGLSRLFDLLLKVLDAPAYFRRVEEDFRDLVNVADLFLIFLSRECVTAS